MFLATPFVPCEREFFFNIHNLPTFIAKVDQDFAVIFQKLIFGSMFLFLFIENVSAEATF